MRTLTRFRHSGAGRNPESLPITWMPGRVRHGAPIRSPMKDHTPLHARHSREETFFLLRASVAKQKSVETYA